MCWLMVNRLMRWLQVLLDDERLKPRQFRERHPIPDDPPSPDTLVREVHQLKCLTAQLWDQVWWHSLPLWKRCAFRVLGFSDPIRRFYLPPK